MSTSDNKPNPEDLKQFLVTRDGHIEDSYTDALIALERREALTQAAHELLLLTKRNVATMIINAGRTALNVAEELTQSH